GRRVCSSSPERGHARAGRGLETPCVHGLAAVGAREHRLDHVPAAAMAEDDCRALRLRRPAVPPLAELDQDPVEVDALPRQAILVARRMLAVELTPEDPLGDERRQPVAEDVAGDPDVAPEVLEAANAEAGLAQDA